MLQTYLAIFLSSRPIRQLPYAAYLSGNYYMQHIYLAFALLRQDISGNCLMLQTYPTITLHSRHIRQLPYTADKSSNCLQQSTYLANALSCILIWQLPYATDTYLANALCSRPFWQSPYYARLMQQAYLASASHSRHICLLPSAADNIWQLP